MGTPRQAGEGLSTSAVRKWSQPEDVGDGAPDGHWQTVKVPGLMQQRTALSGLRGGLKPRGGEASTPPHTEREMYDISERGKTVELLGTCQLRKQRALSAPDRGTSTPARLWTGAFPTQGSAAGPEAPGKAASPSGPPGPLLGAGPGCQGSRGGKRASVSFGQLSRSASLSRV